MDFNAKSNINLPNCFSNTTEHASTCRERAQLNKAKHFELLGTLVLLGMWNKWRREKKHGRFSIVVGQKAYQEDERYPLDIV